LPADLGCGPRLRTSAADLGCGPCLRTTPCLRTPPADLACGPRLRTLPTDLGCGPRLRTSAADLACGPRLRTSAADLGCGPRLRTSPTDLACGTCADLRRADKIGERRTSATWADLGGPDGRTKCGDLLGGSPLCFVNCKMSIVRCPLEKLAPENRVDRV
jgi:hypothetical protein